jgi:uncharacterized membrane protein YgcG
VCVKWGVGDASRQNGVLVLISQSDRAVFISRGSGLRTMLTDHVLDQIIARMKPHLRAGDYDIAFVSAVVDIQAAAAGKDLKRSDASPHAAEQGSWTGLALFFGFIAFFLFLVYRQNSHFRSTIRGQASLDRLVGDIQSAQHSVFMTTSCPICLEPFAADAGTATSNSSVILIPKTLPCGHVFCEPCLRQLLQSSSGSTCPVCRQDVRHLLNGECTSSMESDLQRSSRVLHMQSVAYRVSRMRQLYPLILDRSTHEIMTAAMANGSIAEAARAVEARASEVATMVAKLKSNQSGSKHSSGSSKTSFGGGRSSGGRGGRF